jgi:hypothetical protein
MKKISLLLMICLMAVSSTLLAQEVKVTKKITTLDWLNVAVANANQLHGGLHTYENFTAATTALKNARVQKGMIIILQQDEDGKLPAGTYQLLQEVEITDDGGEKIPKVTDSKNWMRIDGALTTKNKYTRNSLLCPVGTVVTVLNNYGDGSIEPTAGQEGETEVFVLKEISDAGAKTWVSLGAANDSNPTAKGYIYKGGENAVASSLTATNLVSCLALDNSNLVKSAFENRIRANTETSQKPFVKYQIFDFAVTTDKYMWFAIPKGWNPEIVLEDEDESKEYKITDCWTRYTIKKDELKTETTGDASDDTDYEIWACDIILKPTGVTKNLNIKIK